MLMKKYIVPFIGLGMFCLGIFGTYNAFNSFGKTPVEKRDVSTTGTVTEMSVTELQHRIGVTLNSTYRMHYSFQAEDGETYHGEEIVDESEFNALNEGDTIAVMYHSNMPSLNGAPQYSTYISVDALPKTTPTFRLCFSLGTLAFGALLAFLGMKNIAEERAGGHAFAA